MALKTDGNGATTEPYNDRGHRTKETELALISKKQDFPGGDSLTLIHFQNTLFGSVSFNNILNRGERPKNCLTACFEED